MIKFIYISSILISINAWAIVDIVPVEVGDKAVVSGNIAGAYTKKSGNTQKQEYDLSAKIQYDNNKNYVVFFQGSYDYARSQSNKIEDKSFLHARYLNNLNTKTLYAEVFVQYKKNVFKGIDQRLLLGAGLRWKFLNDLRIGKLFLGMGAFKETIDFALSPSSTTTILTKTDEDYIRVNSYIAYSYKISETADINLIGYYQPDVDNSSDYYYSLLAEVIIKIYKQLHLGLKYEMDYDSKPIDDIEKNDDSIKTSLIWKFYTLSR